MQNIFYKSFFRYQTREQIRLWIDTHRQQLIVSAIFTKGTGIGANLVVWAESWTDKSKGFKPSHTGSIIEKDGEILIMDMKPPRASTQSLEEYLWLTKENYVIVLRDFDLDLNMFSKNILSHVGQGYPYMSAIRSVFSKRPTQWANHCSELHLRELQKQDLFTNVNPEITPDELLHVLCKGGN